MDLNLKYTFIANHPFASQASQSHAAYYSFHHLDQLLITLSLKSLTSSPQYYNSLPCQSLSVVRLLSSIKLLRFELTFKPFTTVIPHKCNDVEDQENIRFNQQGFEDSWDIFLL